MFISLSIILLLHTNTCGFSNWKLDPFQVVPNYKTNKCIFIFLMFKLWSKNFPQGFIFFILSLCLISFIYIFTYVNVCIYLLYIYVIHFFLCIWWWRIFFSVEQKIVLFYLYIHYAFGHISTTICFSNCTSTYLRKCAHSKLSNYLLKTLYVNPAFLRKFPK